VGQAMTGLFVAVGEDPYTLMADAARSAMARMCCGRLRREKPAPSFVDYFGWCTWDAFYQQVSQEKVREGLQSFADGGVSPKFIILDDGWQSVRKAATGEERLTAFQANEKFPGDLYPTIGMAKDDFGLKYFFVWHAITGYWGGVDAAAFPRYRICDIQQVFSPGILSRCQDMPPVTITGVVAPEAIHRFFCDYHRHLRLQGVDGVKVDCQAALEVEARSLGGRVALMREYHAALEGSVHTHFFGELINCMSLSNDMLFHALNSTVTRSSTDYSPRDPHSHGLHIYTNAQISYFAGEFILPDWDMFQSGSFCGAFHAAARAISGGPVYVSDTIDGHDFTVLRKLVFSDGTLPRAHAPARPTRDCLFHDPTKEPVLLKVFTHNATTGVIGIFNAGYHENEGEKLILSGTVSAADVEGLAGKQFAVYLHSTCRVICCTRAEPIAISLSELDFEICTVAPVQNGIAPLGLADFYNSGGAISAQTHDSRGVTVSLRDGGNFIAWCACQPASVQVDGIAYPFSYDQSTQLLAVRIDSMGQHSVQIT